MEPNNSSPNDMSNVASSKLVDSPNPTGPSTSQENFGNGTVVSIPSDAYLKVDDGKYEATGFLEEADTLAYTTYQDTPLVVTPNRTAVPSTATTYANEVANMPTKTEGSQVIYNPQIAQAEQRALRPTAAVKGTNVLIPMGGFDMEEFLGCHSAISSSSSRITSVPSGADAFMQGLTGLFRDRGNYREKNNYLRLSDLKNVIISYYNRSIPFTDLDTPERFIIEMGYTRDTADALLPLLAADAVGGYLKWCNKHNMGFNARNAANLYDADVMKELNLIYAAIKDLPVVDEVHFDNLQRYARFHTSSESSGEWGTLIIQDVGNTPLSRLDLTFTSGKYTCRVSCGREWANLPLSLGNFQPTTFMGWVEMFLDADPADLLEALKRVVAYAQSLSSNYAILLGAAMQLQNKGAVKYTTVAAYAPVTGCTAMHLEFAFREPAFSFTYKERFEYAPCRWRAERTGNNNVTVDTSLVDLPPYDSSDVRYQARAYRPVGPYHGKGAWGVNELVEMGVYRVTSADSGEVGIQYIIGSFYPQMAVWWPEVVNGEEFSSAPPVAPTTSNQMVAYVDAFYGDVYLPITPTSTIAFGQVNSDNGPAFTTNYRVTYYSMFNGANGSTATSDSKNPPPITNNLLEISAVTALGDNAGSFYRALALVAEQLDLSNIWVDHPLGAGADAITGMHTTYRQTVWESYDIALIENFISAAAVKLALMMVKKNVREDRSRER